MGVGGGLFQPLAYRSQEQVKNILIVSPVAKFRTTRAHKSFLLLLQLGIMQGVGGQKLQSHYTPEPAFSSTTML